MYKTKKLLIYLTIKKSHVKQMLYLHLMQPE